MFNFLKKAIAGTSEAETIEAIHNEFDSAQDRLLEQAKNILSNLSVPDETEIERAAEELKSIGFFKSEAVREAEIIKQKRMEIKDIIVASKEQAELIGYYQQTYPFLKFITEDALNIICKKYNLLYAPVGNYIKSVPQKNIAEIKSTTPLKQSDIVEVFRTIHIEKYWSGVPSEIKDILEKGIKYDSSADIAYESAVRSSVVKAGYSGNYIGYIYNTAKVKKVDKSGLFIAAPKSHFDLSNVKKENTYGFFNVEEIKINDPIVFRFCRGGVQIISKWGLEASDEIVVNQKMN